MEAASDDVTRIRAPGLLRRRPSRRLIAVVLLVLLAVPGAGITYLGAMRLQRDVVTRFGSAQAHLERARTLVGQASGAQAPATLDQARREFERARADFGAAGAAVDATPLHLVPGRVPFVAPRVAAIEHLSAMGLALCDAGLRSVDVDVEFLKPAGSGQATGTARLLSLLTGTEAALPALRRDLDRARIEAAAVDPAVLPASQRGALGKARADIAKGIAGVDELDRLIPAVGDILAVDGRRTYVVEQVNPFELRPGGGYIGTYSLLVADHGKLSVLHSGDTHELPDYSTFRGQAGYVPPPPVMAGLLQAKSWSFEDTNFYPDFRDSARAAAEFAQRDFGTSVDGVISIDLYAVAALLDVTGPISVPELGVSLTKDSAIKTIMAGDLVEDPAHKRVISSVAGPLMQRLVGLDSGQWLGLIHVLNQLATGRHIQLSFTSARAQPEMERLGLSGKLAFTATDDFLYLGEANFGGSKANYFLTRRFGLAVSRSGGTLRHTLTEDLTLDLRQAPPDYPNYYSFFDRILLPAGATAVSLTGVTPVNPPSMAPPAGVALFEGSGILSADPAGHTGHGQVIYSWSTPWTQDATGAHYIYWQKQPGIAQDAVDVAWNGAAGKSDLGSDKLIALTGSGVTIGQGSAAQVSLPKL